MKTCSLAIDTAFSGEVGLGYKSIGCAVRSDVGSNFVV